MADIIPAGSDEDALDMLIRESRRAVLDGSCTCVDDNLCSAHQRFMDGIEALADKETP